MLLFHTEGTDIKSILQLVIFFTQVNVTVMAKYYG